MSVSAVAKALGLGWETVNTLALSLTEDLVYDHTEHLDGVRVRGVDQHKWKHVRGHGDPSFVTVIVDLTPVLDAARAGPVARDGPGPIHRGALCKGLEVSAPTFHRWQAQYCGSKADDAKRLKDFEKENQ